MGDFPAPVAQRLQQIAFGGEPIACLELDTAGRLVARRGDIGYFGLEPPSPGEPVDDSLHYPGQFRTRM